LARLSPANPNGPVKVWNLLAALDAIEDRDEIVVFVDADTLPAPEWLSRLIAALVNTGRAAVTGQLDEEPIQLGAISFDAAKQFVIANVERRPAKLDRRYHFMPPRSEARASVIGQQDPVCPRQRR
jgi:Glycosyl transferase family 2